MNTIKQQIESGTLNANELILSDTSGQGAFSKLEGMVEESSDTIQGHILNQAQLVAFTRRHLLGKSAGTMAAIAAGYTGINHLDLYKSDDKKPAPKPLVGHYKTADEFEEDSIVEFVNVLDVYKSLTVLSDKHTKTELLAAIANAFALPEERSLAIAEAHRKESALQYCLTELAVYMDNIKASSDKTISGRVKAGLSKEEAATFNRLLSESYTLDSISQIPAKLEGILEVEPAYTMVFLTIKA